MQLNSQDIENCKKLKHVLNNSEIKLKGDAILTVARLFAWFDDLAGRLENEIPKHEFKAENLKPIEKKGKK